MIIMIISPHLQGCNEEVVTVRRKKSFEGAPKALEFQINFTPTSCPVGAGINYY